MRRLFALITSTHMERRASIRRIFSFAKPTPVTFWLKRKGEQTVAGRKVHGV